MNDLSANKVRGPRDENKNSSVLLTLRSIANDASLAAADGVTESGSPVTIVDMVASSAKKKVLIVVYDFPPHRGGGPVLRTLKFAKYLMSTDWEPIILTVKRDDTWMPDEDLLKEVPDISIHRRTDWIGRFSAKNAATDVSENKRETNLLSRLLGFAKNLVKEGLIPDRRAGWLIPATMTGLRIIKEQRIDLIYATAPPQTPLLVGYILSLISKRRLILDYRDSWSSNPLYSETWFPKGWINRKLESLILKRSSLAIAATSQIQESMMNRAKHSVTIFNGYDPEDFVEINPMRLNGNGVKLVYLGGFAGSRTSRFFAEALSRLDRATKEKIAIYVVGVVDAEEQAILSSIKDVQINTPGAVTHKKALEYLMAADYSMIFIFPEEDSDRAVPSKIFEYLAARKPILAFCEKQSALGKLLLDFDLTTIISPKDVDAIADALEAVSMRAGKDYRVSHSANHDALDISRFDRKENALKAAMLFDQVLSDSIGSQELSHESQTNYN